MIIDTKLLDEVSLKAKNSPRLRMNFNFHDSLDSKSQRLLNALEIGTEMPIHRHQLTSETYILVRGHIKVVLYDDSCTVTATYDLNPLEGRFGVHIPANQWHTLEVMEPGSVLFETKDGPYAIITEADILK